MPAETTPQNGLASMVAILISAHRSRDRLAERVARQQLQDAYGVKVTFSSRRQKPAEAEAPQ